MEKKIQINCTEHWQNKPMSCEFIHSQTGETNAKNFNLHPQLSGLITHTGWISALLNITQQRRGQVLCQHQLSGSLWLFIHSFQLYPSIQLAVFLFPHPKSWFHEEMSGFSPALCIANNCDCIYCLLAKVTEDKRGDVLAPWTVFVLQKTRREDLLVHCIHCMFICEDHVTHTQSLH